MPGEPHATYALVRLDHMRANLRAIRAHVGPEPRIMIAVKANGYGHGAVPIARMAEAEGLADWLGVATVIEGVELRRAGVRLPIIKLSNAISDEAIDMALAHDITLTVVDAATAGQVERAAAARGIVADVHLKIDTGMRRLGVVAADAPAAARAVDDLPHLRLTGLFTHLPASDAPDQDGFTTAELDAFYAAVDAVTAELGRPVGLVHAANSGGVLAHPGALGVDSAGRRRVPAASIMVRPGIIVYGSYPGPEVARTIPLLPGLEFRTRVMYVKPVGAGETVGYGRTWTAPRDTWVATIAAGYADGFSRLLSNRGRVLIKGHSYPVVGRVCMDSTMVDLGLDRPDVAIGDDVTLIGRDGDEEITAWEVAELMGTIPYEVTCLLTTRVERRYIG